MPENDIVTTMVTLAGCAKFDRIIVSGSTASQRMLELHRRGYSRVATTSTCVLPQGQYDVGLIEWRLHSIRALEATLNWFVHFLGSAGVLVIWIDTEEHSAKRILTSMVERLGLKVEASLRHGAGLAISARRLDSKILSVAA